MILSEYINEKLELVFQELEKLPREALPEEDWAELCLDRAEMKLNALNIKLANLFSAAV